MPVFRITAPDGTVYRVTGPEGATEQDALAQVQGQHAPAPKAIKVGKEGFGDALREVLGNESWLGRNLAGAGTAPASLWQGAKQLIGKPDDTAIEANRIMAEEAPVGAFAGNLAMLAPTAMIPGANTVAGAGAIGAAQGFLQPTMAGESRGMNTVAGGALGAGGQYLGNKGAQLLQSKLAQALADRTGEQSRNTVRDATLKVGQEAGYVVPPSAVESSVLKKRLESIGGKAAVGQEAASRNQQVTNALARKALGLADDTPLSEGALDAFRNQAAQPYRDVSALPTLPPDRLTGIRGYPLIGPEKQAPAEALRDLKLARSQANDKWKEFARTGVVTAQEEAQALSKKVDALENYLEQTAQAAGRNDLAQALKESRTKIAKSYNVERALNLGTGDISAPILGRALDKGAPLTGELETIAKFQQAFPQYMREGEKIPTPGVSKSEALSAALLAGVGGAAGGPAGMVAGALPLLSDPARKLALSKVMQPSPNYATPATQKVLQKLTPERAALLAKALAASALPTAAGLAAQ
jgi:hypothetical protein